MMLKRVVKAMEGAGRGGTGEGSGGGRVSSHANQGLFHRLSDLSQPT